jgi:hypothetical protein
MLDTVQRITMDKQQKGIGKRNDSRCAALEPVKRAPKKRDYVGLWMSISRSTSFTQCNMSLLEFGRRLGTASAKCSCFLKSG